MRATTERTGLDARSRTPKIQIRRMRKTDLARVREVIEQAFGDLLERKVGTRPRQVFQGAQYVHHRWMSEPWGCFVAEEEQSKIVGAALSAHYGSVGLLGPVAVLTNYQNQSIGQQLVAAVQAFFEEQKLALQGTATYPTSSKHLALYHRFGFKPKGLVAIMSRSTERREPRPEPVRGWTGIEVRRFSQLDEPKKKAAVARCARLTAGICRGLDLTKEIEIVEGLALGDTLLFERGRDLAGFAIYHAPGVSEAPTGALYTKFLALDPHERRGEALASAVGAVEDLAVALGLGRMILPVYLRYWQAYATLVRLGYEIDFTMLRMQRGKLEDYEDPGHLVLDDWR